MMHDQERNSKPLRDLIQVIHLTEHVGAKIHGVLDKVEVLNIVGEEFGQSERYAASILLLTDDGASLGIATSSDSPERLKAGEKATGLRMEGYKIDLHKSRTYSRVVKEGDTVQVQITDLMGELFPRPVATLISRVMGYERRPAIVTPLSQRGKIIGALAVSSTDLAEYLVPSVRTLAQHISTALELADEYAERKQAEDALQEREEQLRALVESSSDHIFMLNRDGVYLTSNGQVRQFGLDSGQDLVGRLMSDVYPPKVAELYQGQLERVLAIGQPVEFEHPMPEPDGYHHHLDTLYPVFLHGEVVAVGGICRDITERKQAEEVLRHQAETLTALHETALDLGAQRALPDLLQAIVVRAMNLLMAAGGGIYLYRPETDDLELGFTHHLAPSFKGIVLQRGEGLSGKVLVSGRPLAIADYPHWEGRSKKFEDTALPACAAVPISWGGRTLGVLYLADDMPRTFSPDDVTLLESFAPLAAAALENHRLISDLKQQMKKLKRTQAQLVQSTKLAAVGELSAGVAHEINNPLTSILGFAEVLRERMSAAESPFDEELGIIAEEARRVSRIVRALLDFARQTKPESEPADINQVLQKTLIVIRYHLEKSGVVIEEDYASDIGPVPLDEEQMKQVFLNLISNAFQAMPEGGKLNLRTARIGDEVAVLFTDTGVGIPPENLERIFDPFFSTRPSGTGLGLSVSLGIVQEHGGRITMESEEGRGSTVTVWLPVEMATGEGEDS
jgi:PAS domain S-box-containing protein